MQATEPKEDHLKNRKPGKARSTEHRNLDFNKTELSSLRAAYLAPKAVQCWPRGILPVSRQLQPGHCFLSRLFLQRSEDVPGLVAGRTKLEVRIVCSRQCHKRRHRLETGESTECCTTPPDDKLEALLPFTRSPSPFWAGKGSLLGLKRPHVTEVRASSSEGLDSALRGEQLRKGQNCEDF